MLNNRQIKLVQTAVRAAGFRSKNDDGRYRLLLRQYTAPNGRPVESCKQLANGQVDDLLAICEAHGWSYPGKPADFYRQRVAEKDVVASYAQQHAMRMLAGDLGWNENQLGGMVKRMTHGRASHPAATTPGEAHIIIEAMKNMFGRERKTTYQNLKDVQADAEATDGKKQAG